MSTENLWGEITEQTAGPAPINLLREQADLLTKMTNGLLTGIAHTQAAARRFNQLNSYLSVRVASLNNYEVTLIKVQQPLLLYPLHITDHIAAKSYDCSDYESFKVVLKQILSSDQMKKVLSGLLRQADKA